MPSFNTNILPTSTGLNLGASNQEWNAWLNLLNGAIPVSMTVSPTPFVPIPAFSSTSPLTIITMTLTGNVTSSTYSGVTGLVVFQITQDSFGSRTFAWPSNFNGASAPEPTANSVTSQLFYYDGMNAWPLGPGAVFP